jgi:hypothetical protein
MASNGAKPNPVTAAVVASVAAVLFLLTAGAAVGGAWLVALDVAHKQNVAEAMLRTRETQSQIRTSVPICRALVDMSDAAKVPPQDFPSPPANGYDKRLSVAITSFVQTSKCQVILTDLAHHESYEQIAHQLGG